MNKSEINFLTDKIISFEYEEYKIKIIIYGTLNEYDNKIAQIEFFIKGNNTIIKEYVYNDIDTLYNNILLIILSEMSSSNKSVLF